MNVFNFIYFTVASICTNAFNINVFIAYIGVFGYFALSLMASYSIAKKSPFTIRVSKKDWPEAYWREKTLSLVNNIVSAVWMFIFFVNALINLFFGVLNEVLFSNVLIVLGVVFLIVSPVKAPAYFVVKNTWNHLRDLIGVSSCCQVALGARTYMM